MKLFRSLLPLAAAAAVAAAAQAQEFTVRVLTLGAGQPAEQLHVHQDGGPSDVGTLEVKSFLNHETDTLKLKKPQVVLTTQAGAASVKDEASLVGSCTLPAKGGSVLLLLVPEKPEEGPACKILVIDDSLKGFPAGSFKVVNLCASDIRIQLEDKPFDFKAGEIRDVVKPPLNASSAAAMKAMVQAGGEWKVFSSGLWPGPGGKRVLQVVLDGESGHPVIRGFRDVAVP